MTSVFSNVFSLNADHLLDYDYLCVMTGMKKLKRPSVSNSFSWNGQEVASLAGQGSNSNSNNFIYPRYYFTIKIEYLQKKKQLVIFQ